jgi:hypothetical protein
LLLGGDRELLLDMHVAPSRSGISRRNRASASKQCCHGNLPVDEYGFDCDYGLTPTLDLASIRRRWHVSNASVAAALPVDDPG